MDPSYNNGFGGSGAGGQSLSQPGVSGAPIVSGGAATPGGEAAMLVAPAPISSGIGDVILAPEVGGRGPRRGVVVGVIAGVLALALMVVLGMWAGGGNWESNTVLSERELFNRYANYLLSGEDVASDLVGEYKDSKYYALDEAFDNDDLAFFEKLNTFWNEYYESYDAEKLSENAYLYGMVDLQNRLMDFITRYMRLDKMDDIGVLNLYVVSGRDGAISAIREKYGDLLETIYEPGVSYAESDMRLRTATVDVYEQYNAAGCIKDGEVEVECATELQLPEDIASQYMEAVDSSSFGVVSDSVRFLESGCYNIADFMEGENDEE